MPSEQTELVYFEGGRPRATTTICAFNRWLGFGTAFYRSGEWFSVGLLQRPFAHLIFTFYLAFDTFETSPPDLTFAGHFDKITHTHGSLGVLLPSHLSNIAERAFYF